MELKGIIARTQAKLFTAQDASPFSDSYPDQGTEEDGDNTEAKRKEAPAGKVKGNE